MLSRRARLGLRAPIRDFGCPCNFNARPTTGKCEGGWTWIIDEGELDGPWAIFINTYELDGPHFAPFDVELSEHTSRFTIGDVARLEMEPIRNPVTGVESHPSVRHASVPAYLWCTASP